jgi:hypothetical protein
MSDEKTIDVSLRLPVTARIKAKLIDDEDEFDIISVELSPFQPPMNERTIFENCRDDDIEHILNLLKKEKNHER